MIERRTLQSEAHIASIVHRIAAEEHGPSRSWTSHSLRWFDVQSELSDSVDPMKTNKLKPFIATASLVITVAAALNNAISGLTTSTQIEVRIGNSLSSAIAKNGELFNGTVTREAVVGGKTMVAAGTPVKGKVIYAKPSSKSGASGILRLKLTDVGGQKVNSSAFIQHGNNNKGEALVGSGTVVSFTVTPPQGAKSAPRHR